MKALIFLFFAFLLPSCSLFQPVTNPVTTRTERLVEGYTPSVIRTDTLPAPYWRYQLPTPPESKPGVLYFDGDSPMHRNLDVSPKAISYADLSVQISTDRDSTWYSSPYVIDYEVVSPESSITIIKVNTITSTVTGYSFDSDGQHTEFILSYTLSPWHRDNEKVYDTVLGPVRIVEHPVIFLPYSGRISIGDWQWQIK